VKLEVPSFIDTDVADVPDSIANTAVSVAFAGLIGRETVH